MQRCYDYRRCKNTSSVSLSLSSAMKVLTLIGLVIVLASCGSKTYHAVSVRKPIYHHTWYKKSRWHNQNKIGPLQFRFHWHIFEKQGAKKVKMYG